MVSFLLPPGLEEHTSRHRVHFSFGNPTAEERARIPQIESQSWFSADREQHLYLQRTIYPSDSGVVRSPTTADTDDLTECADTVDGRPLLIHAYRAADRLWINGVPRDAYVVEGTFRLAPTVDLMLSSTARSPEGQRRVLAVIRSVHFIDR